MVSGRASQFDEGGVIETLIDPPSPMKSSLPPPFSEHTKGLPQPLPQVRLIVPPFTALKEFPDPTKQHPFVDNVIVTVLHGMVHAELRARADIFS